MIKRIVLVIIIATIASLFSTFVCADTDGNTVEMGLESNPYYDFPSSYNPNNLSNPTYADDLVNGLYTQIHGTNSNWGKQFNFVGSSVWETDFKAVSLGGDDDIYADDVDLLAYCGHGYAANGLCLATQHNDIYVARSDLILGNKDLEWFLTYTCNFLNSSNSSIGDIFHGLHILCGYSSDMTVTANGGTLFGIYACAGNSVRSAWVWYAVNSQPVFSLNTAAAFYHNSCMYDRLWGFGYVAEDPPGYNSSNASQFSKYEYFIFP